MPEHQQRSNPTLQSTVVKASDSGASTTQQDAFDSNLEIQEEVIKAGSSAGLENYRQTLGSWLGTELYEAVSDEIQLDSVAQHADKALTSAIRSAAANIGKLEDHPNVGMDPGFADAFSRAVAMEFEGVASAWVNSSSGKALVNRLQNWTDANPETVATVAVLAAGGAIAANMDIPELKHKFDLGNDWRGSVGVDLGSFRDIALEEVKGKLEYHSGNLMMAFEAGHSEERGTSAGFSLKYSW